MIFVCALNEADEIIDVHFEKVDELALGTFCCWWRDWTWDGVPIDVHHDVLHRLCWDRSMVVEFFLCNVACRFGCCTEKRG